MDQQTIEQRLRTALREEQLPTTGWPDPVSRIEHGITRRRRTRWIAITAAVATLLVGTVTVGLIGRRPDTTPTKNVAVDATEPVTAPTVLRRSPRPDRQPCRLDRVDSLDWIVQSAPWGAATGFALRPSNDERCTLSGKPQLFATNVATGMSEPVPAVDLGPLDSSIARQFPATVDPGEMARVHIRGNNVCQADQQPQSYRDLVLVVGGNQLKVPKFRTLANVCGADVSPWFVEPPMEYAALNVSLDAPPVLRRGEDFTYVVRIDNVFSRVFSMLTCPVYRLTPASDSEPWRRIHCSVTAIGARSSLRFTLRGHIPADTALGKLKLTWMAVMSNGEAAIADMGSDGFSVTITE